MVTSRPAVHPLEVAAPPPPPPPPAGVGEHAELQPQGELQPEEQAVAAAPPEGVLMVYMAGMPGTLVGLLLRIAQVLLAVTSIAVMSSTKDFWSVEAFRELVVALAVQGLWSLVMVIVDVYAMMVRRGIRNRWAIRFIAIGDMITGGITFSGATAAAGITALLDNSLTMCNANPCAKYKSAVAVGFLCLFSLAPCCLINLWSMSIPH